MRRRAAFVVLVAIFGFVMAALPATSRAALAASQYDTVIVEGTADYDAAQEQLTLTNAERAKKGRAPLKMSRSLQETAMRRAAECAVYYSHTRPNGSSHLTAFPSSGGWWGENIACGFAVDAQKVTTMWVNSAGHYENMLRSEYSYVGIGCVRVGNIRFWAQDFAGSAGNVGSGSGTSEVSYTVSVDYGTVPASRFKIGSLTAINEIDNLLSAGETSQLTVRVVYHSPNESSTVPTSPRGYTWRSSNTAVATVDANGVVRAQNVAGGTATISATSPGGHTWSKTFTIEPNLSGATVAKIADKTYTGQPITVHPTVTLGNRTLVEGTDYEIEYPSLAWQYTDVGTVTITIRGRGEFEGSTTTATYQIVPRDLGSATVSLNSYQPDPSKPAFTLMLNGRRLFSDVDYDVTYMDGPEPDTILAVAVGKGNYTGRLGVLFEPKDSGQTTSPGGTTGSNTGSSNTGSTSQSTARITMYRLYNQWTGEHFYTASATERSRLVDVGWDYEGVGWYAPKSGDPVYRLYNPYAEGGDHHYTRDLGEYRTLQKLGWRAEGTGWSSGGSVAVYRQYNPNATTGTHNYTPNKVENDALVRAGWREEGIAWYGVR